MNTGQSVVMLHGWGVKAGGWRIPCEWQVKQCDHSLTRAILSTLEVSSHEKCLVFNILNSVLYFPHLTTSEQNFTYKNIAKLTLETAILVD